MESSEGKLFELVISKDAANDIEEAAFYFEQKVPGLGLRFSEELRLQLRTLRKNPFFQLRYKNVRCFPMANFPFLVHFTVDEKEAKVNVRAVLHTSLDPKIWKNR
ncbi:hypothetical protein J0A68_08680 [Algoriphagus sp. H41]|uniref:Type II toxin-antitoxin system RelE/ParE family toxin n=1 Tax=Algoriphagus oliviformis TaxID=2811231 RepID=A0ABS3C1P0_9BACT|nr:type II toxin-antitoxin system RelE/ParE family toxin [Algoriphagus oliviformis]MBN7811028.1 hypothetical protein [Algoriphagus oliviformis]